MVHELVIHFRHGVLQRGNGLRRTDARHNVLALRVHQELAVELLFAGGGIAREGNAGARIFTHVAKYHRLYVHGGAPAGGDIVHAAVVDGAGVIPGAEHGLDGLHQLFLGILRKSTPLAFL